MGGGESGERGGADGGGPRRGRGGTATGRGEGGDGWGMCVLWGNGGWMMASGGESPGAKDNEVVWQLIDAGADGKASAPVLKRENWLGGDDVLLAVREIPKGGGVASGGTTWDDQLLQTGGVAVYVDATRHTGGKVYQRLYQGRTKEGGAYFQTGLFEFGATHTWAGDPPELFYFDGAGNGFAMDREVAEEQGSEANPIQIATREDWEALVAFVAGGGDTEGVFYKQTADIAGVTNGVGTMELPFRGTYDGDGKTLTVSLAGGNGMAPFSGIEGATIRNLTVAGSVVGGMHCAGLVGYAEGMNLIESCVVRASVVTTNTHCGGFVGHGRASQTTLSGCVFWGEVSGTTEETLSLATIWGWSEGATVTLGGVSVTGVGAGAFAGSGELTGVWIPDGVVSVGAGAFEGSGLAELSVPGAWKDSGVLEGAGLPEGCQVIYRGGKIRIMAIGVGSNSVSLQFDQDASTVFGTDDLKGEWKAIPRTDFTLEGTNATIPLEKAFRFLRAE